MTRLSHMLAATLLASIMTGATEAAAADMQPPALQFVFEERVDLETPEPTGPGPRGNGNRIGIVGGTISGPMLQGKVLPGGADWQLIRADGCTDIVADYFIRAEDKALIHVRNVGLACPPGSGRGAYARAIPVFTAPIGKHDWLNKSVFVSTIDPVVDAQGNLRQVVLRFYAVP
jgi:Protein of unknown function (DUF3237)